MNRTLNIAASALVISTLTIGCASQPQGGEGAKPMVVSNAETGKGSVADSPKAIKALNQKSCPSNAKSFSDWVRHFQSFALHSGQSEEAVFVSFQGVKENPQIATAAAAQPEFVTPVWTYLDRAVSPERVARGKEMFAAHRGTLAAVSRKYGIDEATILGIWGIETDFGRNFGSINVFEALSNLGYRAHRYAFACSELLAALEIVAKDHMKPERMTGSWAGAMGHPQFLPSSYLKLAVDEDGSGAPDLWRSMPDVFASIANHLKQHGWRPGLPWGFEVRLPANFPYEQAELDQYRPVEHWRKIGVKKIDGSALTGLNGDAAIFLPAGWTGPAFLLTPNFDAVLKYNYSTSYALAVEVLGGQTVGTLKGIQANWPREEEPLSLAERQEVQSLLAEAGFDPGSPDGVLGIKTRKAARAFQEKLGLPADGFITKGLLATLRARS